MPLFRRGERASTLDLLVVGLGNPGRAHERDRHNVGTMVVYELARLTTARSRGSSAVAWWRDASASAPGAAQARDVHERLGPSRAAAVRFFKVPRGPPRRPRRGGPLGRLQARRGGGPAGHNGLRSRASGSGPPTSPGSGSAWGGPDGETRAPSRTRALPVRAGGRRRGASSAGGLTRSSRSSRTVSKRRSAASTRRSPLDPGLGGLIRRGIGDPIPEHRGTGRHPRSRCH